MSERDYSTERERERERAIVGLRGLSRLVKSERHDPRVGHDRETNCRLEIGMMVKLASINRMAVPIVLSARRS